MQNHSNGNEFDLHENGPVGDTQFLMNGFARRLVLKQRQRITRKWPIQWNNTLSKSGYPYLAIHKID